MLRSILKIPIGHGCTVVVHSRNRRSFPAPGFLKVDWVAFGVWYWVIWQEPRCCGSRNDLGWLVTWKTLWNWCLWGILCLSLEASFNLCRAAVWPRLVAKLSERGFFFAKIEWWMIRRICGRNLDMVAVVLVGDGLVVVETLGGGIVAEAPRGRAVLLQCRPPALLGGNGGGNSRRSRKRRNCWRSMIRSISSGKRRQRRRRGQWNCRSKQRCWSWV